MFVLKWAQAYTIKNWNLEYSQNGSFILFELNEICFAARLFTTSNCKGRTILSNGRKGCNEVTDRKNKRISNSTG